MLFSQILTSLLLIYVPVSAFCDSNGINVKAVAGFNVVSMSRHPSADFDIEIGQMLGLSIGYRFTDIVRLEAEGCYRSNEMKKLSFESREGKIKIPLHGNISSASFMGNVLIDPPFKFFMKPYFGLGLGSISEYAHDWRVDIQKDEHIIDVTGYDRTAMAYQGILGFHICDQYKMHIGFEFRFLDSLLDHMCNFNRSFLLTMNKEF